MLSFLLILWCGLIWLTMQFQSLKYLPNLDRFIHSSIYSTNITESLWSARHLKLERLNYSIPGLCKKKKKNTIHIHTKWVLQIFTPYCLLVVWSLTYVIPYELFEVPLISTIIQNIWWYYFSVCPSSLPREKKKTTWFFIWTFW